MVELRDCEHCTACDLALTRHRVVISRGAATAPLMLIGEAPGAREDALGQPFVGRSGQLLDRLLLDVGFDPENDLYICNAVKCRPPQNRRPPSCYFQKLYKIQTVRKFSLYISGLILT